MKFLSFLFLVCILPFLESFRFPSVAEGAYVFKHEQGEDWLLIQDNYLVETSFSKEARRFLYTKGGLVQTTGDGIDCRWEFDSRNAAAVGTSSKQFYGLKNGSISQGNRLFKKTDEGGAGIPGYYRISARKIGEATNSMPLGARKTIKVLTGRRFQWTAINTSTGEFFGTGGGSYTFDGAAYTEHIEFFSRDSTRVGASLTFTDTLKEKSWIHTGLSSKGDPIYEIWTREPIAY